MVKEKNEDKGGERKRKKYSAFLFSSAAKCVHHTWRKKTPDGPVCLLLDHTAWELKGFYFTEK